MNSAYYSNKIPKYWEDIKNGKRKVATWFTIRKDLADTMKNIIQKQYVPTMQGLMMEQQKILKDGSQSQNIETSSLMEQ